MCLMAKNKHITSERTGGGYTFKLNFITLTLSSEQIHSDNEIKAKLLNQFLVELRSVYSCKYYLWRAESQRNGRIHFHVVTDVFIPWRRLRTQWNRIQEKLGYISRYSERTGNTDPNSTDVHSIRAIKNLPSYLSKYCSKNAKGYTVLASKVQEGPLRPTSWLTYKHPRFNPATKFYRQIRGRLWGLSQSLSRLKACQREVSEEIHRELELLKAKRPDRVRFKDHVCIFLFDVYDLVKYQCKHLIGRMREYTVSSLSSGKLAV